jgi:hypothetical protein
MRYIGIINWFSYPIDIDLNIQEEYDSYFTNKKSFTSIWLEKYPRHYFIDKSIFISYEEYESILRNNGDSCCSTGVDENGKLYVKKTIETKSKLWVTIDSDNKNYKPQNEYKEILKRNKSRFRKLPITCKELYIEKWIEISKKGFFIPYENWNKHDIIE